MEATSLFVTSLDRRREWYRYHDLFREFLLGELRRTEPGIMITLHRRAAAVSPVSAASQHLSTASGG